MLLFTYINTMHQVLDYGIAMRMDDYELGMSYMYKIIKVMACLGCNEYTRPMLINACLLQYHKRNNTTFHQMISSNFSILDEEPGEISFSILSRFVLGDHQKCKFNHVSKAYTMLNAYRHAVEQLVGEDIQMRRKSKYEIKPDSDEVQLVQSCLRTKLLQARRNVMTEYDGSLVGWKNLIQANQHQVQTRTAVLKFKSDIIPECDKQWTYVTRHMLGIYFLGHHADIWPEVNNDPQVGVSEEMVDIPLHQLIDPSDAHDIQPIQHVPFVPPIPEQREIDVLANRIQPIIQDDLDGKHNEGDENISVSEIGVDEPPAIMDDVSSTVTVVSHAGRRFMREVQALEGRSRKRVKPIRLNPG